MDLNGSGWSHVEISTAEADDFGHADAGVVHDREQRAIAAAAPCGSIRRVEHSFHFGPG
jgi:hypothetical protein